MLIVFCVERPSNTCDVTHRDDTSTIEVSSICSHLSNFKTTEPLDLHLEETHRKTVFIHHKVSFSPENI